MIQAYKQLYTRSYSRVGVEFAVVSNGDAYCYQHFGR